MRIARHSIPPSQLPFHTKVGEAVCSGIATAPVPKWGNERQPTNRDGTLMTFLGRCKVVEHKSAQQSCNSPKGKPEDFLRAVGAE